MRSNTSNKHRHVPSLSAGAGDGPRALTLPEIRLRIFKELDFRNLFYAALVCRAWAWAWPAIDTRWRSHPIRFGLVMRPQMNRRSIESWSDSPSWSLYVRGVPRPSADSEPSQLDYARKVNHLILVTEWDEDPEYAKGWFIGHHGSPICPNLLSLKYEIDTADDTLGALEEEDRWSKLLQLLVGPNLESVTLTIRDATKQVANDNIRTLARIAPRLHNVTINSWGSCSADFAALDQLRSLEVNGFVNHESWKSLVDCPRLERIVLCEDDSCIEIEPQSYSITFPRLKALHIRDCCAYRAPEFVVALFRNTTMPMLRTFQVVIQASDERRASAKNEILGYVCGRSPILKEVMINGPVAGYDNVI
ncbi:hypothetical protein FRB94_013315 [Tulasnella sp. JGI-2019a]|nr:hypothetical protein FRB94_013315 [Tulasnella sp. JGI-2019a]